MIITAWSGKKRGTAFLLIRRRHNLHLGSVTGLEKEHAQPAADRRVVAPDLYWWGPRALFPDNELFVELLEDPSVVQRFYIEFERYMPDNFSKFAAVQNMRWPAARDSSQGHYKSA